LTQQSTLEPARKAPRILRSLSDAAVRRLNNVARVVVAWHKVSEDGAAELEPTEVELEADLAAPTSATWVSRLPSGLGWAEALSSAACSEVVLTARIDDPTSKHLVFELAGLLSLRLAATQPLIRVRFLPPVGARRRARSAA
jgi:hypothetical protein